MLYKKSLLIFLFLLLGPVSFSCASVDHGGEIRLIAVSKEKKRSRLKEVKKEPDEETEFMVPMGRAVKWVAIGVGVASIMSPILLYSLYGLYTMSCSDNRGDDCIR